MALYNPSTNAFVDLSAADGEVLQGMIDTLPEMTMPEPLEEFDHWLDRLSRLGEIVVLKPDERDARVIGAARRSGRPVIQRTIDPAPAPADKVRTVEEYLNAKNETREQAVNRVLHRFGQPGRARTIEETPRSFPDVARPISGKVVA
jgi:hypothetical protein